MDITKLSLIELKAMAYDTLANLEMYKKNLDILNQEIAKKSEEEKKEDLSNNETQ